VIGTDLKGSFHGHRITPSLTKQPYWYAGAVMDIAVAIIQTTVIVIIGVWTYWMRGLEQRVTDILRDAIRKEIILQDDRIQKRNQRLEGQASDTARTGTDNSVEPIIGRPYRKS